MSLNYDPNLKPRDTPKPTVEPDTRIFRPVYGSVTRGAPVESFTRDFSNVRDRNPTNVDDLGTDPRRERSKTEPDDGTNEDHRRVHSGTVDRSHRGVGSGKRTGREEVSLCTK